MGHRVVFFAVTWALTNKGSFLSAGCLWTQKSHGVTGLSVLVNPTRPDSCTQGSLSTCGCDTAAPSLKFPDGDAFLYEVSVTSGITSNFLGKCRVFGKRAVADTDTDTHFPKLHVLLESSCLSIFF